MKSPCPHQPPAPGKPGVDELLDLMEDCLRVLSYPAGSGGIESSSGVAEDIWHALASHGRATIVRQKGHRVWGRIERVKK